MYKIKITNKENENEIIELVSKDTKEESVTFKIDTIEQDVYDRSSNIVNIVTIKGIIEESNKGETKKLLEWSLEKSKASIYRKVVIENYINQELVREYHLNNAFCVDYTETFKGDNGEYELILSQRKSSLEEIKFYDK